METPRIRIEDKEQIRILICHLIYSLGCPLTREQLIEITSYEQAVNYFDLTEALETIGERHCIITEQEGAVCYSNTAIGIKAAKELAEDLPQSVREKMFEEAVRVYTRDVAKQHSSILSVRYANNPKGNCTMGISIKDDSGRQKYYLNVITDTAEQAESIKSKLKKDPRSLREYLDEYFK